MSTAVVKFGSVSLKNTGLAGIIKPDTDGYYTMVVGGLNIFNSAGQYYSYEGAKAIFESSSQFMRRIGRGALRGEVGHPRQEPGQTTDAYINRIMDIRESNVCVHFKEIYLDFNSVKDREGRPIIAIMAKLAPSGPHGPMLAKMLENKAESVCFSIRAFTKDFMNRGIYTRELKNVVTFDYVNEPGIHIAEKWTSPTLESLSDSIFTKEQIERAIAPTKGPGLATESAVANAQCLFDSMGWKMPKNVTPAFTKW